jgi:Rrf2 family transcriptional regulator, nitric oxide-sensitive transcriptional repressor
VLAGQKSQSPVSHVVANGQTLRDEMRLTMQTDYALRMLIQLGVHTNRLVTIGEAASTYRVSKNHMMKVAHRLCLEGFVVTVRGNGGGLRLARRPSEINIGDVVRRMETDFSLVGCFEPRRDDCRIHSACLLRSAMQRALKAFHETLDDYTLQDLLVTRPLLEELFAQDLLNRKVKSA